MAVATENYLIRQSRRFARIAANPAVAGERFYGRIDHRIEYAQPRCNPDRRCFDNCGRFGIFFGATN